MTDHIEPYFVYTEEEAVAEGEVVKMDAWGIASFHGDPIPSVSRALFAALQDAFGLAATAGLDMTRKGWAEALEERAEAGQTVPDIDDLDGRTGLVPPWAVLGDLLQVLIAEATDTAEPGEPADWLYTTGPIKALQGEPIWLQRPRPGQWTAFLPSDY